MKRPSLFALCVSLFSLSCLSLPAQAALQRSADFSEGHSIGLGLYGLAYDYGIGGFSAGLSVASAYGSFYSPNLSEPLKPGLRLVGRFYEQDGLSAAALAGLQFDPGYPGNRSYLTPDLGVAVAYDFRQFDVPLAIRMNLSLALREDRTISFLTGPSGSEQTQPQGNVFQRLGFGPNTSLEVAWFVNDNFEVTAGGGTLLGMRLKF
ncbi:MAG: hypothetical protein ACO1RX_03565 [Candidatus Sericytochromatia bacterium]